MLNFDLTAPSDEVSVVLLIWPNPHLEVQATADGTLPMRQFPISLTEPPFTFIIQLEVLWA